MQTRLTRCSSPFYIQFELTQRCNNRCFFCYNDIGQVLGNELTTSEVKRILGEVAEAGVFRVNFNGGEPLLRDDLLELCAHAREQGLELHMNTNATRMTGAMAAQLAGLMPSVCTSLLSSTPERHDAMSSRPGAFCETLQGIDLLRRHGVGVEVNVCTTMDNYQDLYAIAKVAAAHGCYALCATRYILTDASQAHLVMTPAGTVELIEILTQIRRDIPGIEDVSLPGPVPLCEVPSNVRDELRRLNVPCQYGYGLCRISATGIVTPCTISPHELGSLRDRSFKEVWNDAGWERYVRLEHIPRHCHACDEFPTCGGGCIVYDECLMASGISPQTRKWTGPES